MMRYFVAVGLIIITSVIYAVILAALGAGLSALTFIPMMALWSGIWKFCVKKEEPEVQIFVLRDNQPLGPYNKKQVEQMLAANSVQLNEWAYVQGDRGKCRSLEQVLKDIPAPKGRAGLRVEWPTVWRPW